MQQENKQNKDENVQRQNSFNLNGKNSDILFHRIMVRLKVHKVVKHWKKLSKNSFNRYKRLQQWVNTQKAYIEDLKLIVNKIQKPLRQKNLITEDQQRIIFPNMDGIIMLSQMMFQTMKQFLNNWHPYKTQIASAVIKLSNFFKIYIEYFSNYLKGKNILDKIRHKSEYKAIQNSLKMDFDSYLSKPTQRPVKYKLLLTDYQKKLRTDHPDYKKLTEAIQKYHQVVQTTNQALQNQKRTRRMIEIQQKFKNILQSSRQWKFQFSCYYEEQQNPCLVFVFTDLVLVVLSKRGEKQKLLSKMLLDGNCFVQACEQVYEQKFKKIFMAGKEENGYFLFSSLQQRNKIFQQLSKLINSLHVNQWKRRQALSKNLSNRFSNGRMSKPFFVQDYYEVFDEVNTLKKKFRITAIGVLRRNSTKNKNQYFVIKLQLPFPEVINQKAFVKFEDLEDLDNLLIQSLYKWALVKDQNRQKRTWNPVNQVSKQLQNCQWMDMQSKFIEYRLSRIQNFLNFVLRNKQTMKNSNLIFHKLKMFQSLYDYLTDDKNECVDCNICQNGDIISNFQTYNDQMKSRIKLKNQRNEQNFCIYRSFHVQNRLSSQSKMNPRSTPQQILLFINSKQGSINSSLTNRIIQGQQKTIRIYRPMFKDLQNQKNQVRSAWNQVKIYKKDTVGNVLQLLKQKLGIYSIKDFGLVLVNNQGLFSILHEDQYIMDVIRDNDIAIQKLDEKSNQLSKSTFRSFLSKIKINLQQKVDQITQRTPNIRIQLRKIYLFPAQVQSLACSNDDIRCKLLCDQIFYQFKNRTINMHHQNIVKLVVYFICIQYNDRIMMLKRNDITKSLIENVFPSTRLYMVNQNFLIQLWKVIQIYQQKGIKRKQLFQSQLVALVNDNQGWMTQFFNIENLAPVGSLGVNQKNLQIGINCQNFLLIRQNNKTLSLIKIRIDKLKIKYSGYFIIINDQQKEYKFKCQQMFMFRNLLQKYEAYNKYFLGIDKIVGRPLMEETI